jgi:hypothetical protein
VNCGVPEGQEVHNRDKCNMNMHMLNYCKQNVPILHTSFLHFHLQDSSTDADSVYLDTSSKRETKDTPKDFEEGFVTTSLESCSPSPGLAYRTSSIGRENSIKIIAITGDWDHCWLFCDGCTH